MIRKKKKVKKPLNERLEAFSQMTMKAKAAKEPVGTVEIRIAVRLSRNYNSAEVAAGHTLPAAVSDTQVGYNLALDTVKAQINSELPQMIELLKQVAPNP